MTKIKDRYMGEGNLSEAVKNWVMVLLTLGFVVLYGLALLGKLRPFVDVATVTRLEPIIFVIIGYFFGRFPGQQNEQALKDEIARQMQRADAAQHAKETALQSREALDEKVKNARTALAAEVTSSLKQTPEIESATDKRGSVAAAFNILCS